MTDDELDTMLHAAGERWRASHTDAVDVAPERLGDGVVDIEPGPPPPARARRRTWWAAAASAAAAVLVAVLAVVLARAGADGDHTAASDGGPLAGTWNATTLTDAGAATRLVAPITVTLTDHEISGTDGCNHLGGPVRVSGDTIVIGDLASTAMGCIDRPAGFDEAVAFVHRLLSGTVHWSVASRQLTLRKDGVGELRFAQQAEPPEPPGSTTDPAALRGTSWQLISVATGGPAGSSSSVSSRVPTLNFGTDGSFSGVDGCNGLFGRIVVGAGRFDLAEIGTTLADCVGHDDGVIYSVLNAHPSWSITGDQLTITNGKTTVVAKRVATTAPLTSEPSATGSATSTR
jgi:heat shock protein HslJ